MLLRAGASITIALYMKASSSCFELEGRGTDRDHPCKLKRLPFMRDDGRKRGKQYSVRIDSPQLIWIFDSEPPAARGVLESWNMKQT